MGKWLIFVEKERLEKTIVWDILKRWSGEHLGEIRWNPYWRQYWSLPDIGTGWAKSCHREVADFIEKQMEARKKR